MGRPPRARVLGPTPLLRAPASPPPRRRAPLASSVFFSSPFPPSGAYNYQRSYSLGNDGPPAAVMVAVIAVLSLAVAVAVAAVLGPSCRTGSHHHQRHEYRHHQDRYPAS